MNLKIYQFLFVFLGLFSLTACGGKDRRDYLTFPKLVGADSANARIFVVDDRNNRLNLIVFNENGTEEVQGFYKDDKQPLLNDEEALLLPAFPKDLAVYSPAAGVSRLLVLGVEEDSSYVLRVLDYDGSAITELEASPLALPSGGTSVYGRLLLNVDANQLWLSEPEANQVHVLALDAFAPITGSPVAVGALPQDLSLDLANGLVAVSQAEETFISLVDTAALTVSTLELGLPTKAVALAPGEGGVLGLVALILGENRLVVYRLDLADLTQSVLLSDLAGPTVADVSSDLFTGSLDSVAAGLFSDGTPAAFVPQSSGDVLRLIFDSALTTVTPDRIVIGAASTGQVAFYPDNLAMEKLYFPSPSTGILNILDPDVDNPAQALLDQVP